MNLCLQRNFVQENVEGGSLERGQLWLLFRDGLQLSYPDGLQEEDWEELMGKDEEDYD